MIHSTQLHSVNSKEREYLEGWQRARAELDNFRKRVLAEQEQVKEHVTQAVIESLLQIADNFQAIVAHTPAHLQNDNWVQGVHHVARQVEQMLAAFGVTPIDKAKGRFDPAIHEAVEKIDKAKGKSGHVIGVVQRGYRLGQTVIRPAKVRVVE